MSPGKLVNRGTSRYPRTSSSALRHDGAEASRLGREVMAGG